MSGVDCERCRRATTRCLQCGGCGYTLRDRSSHGHPVDIRIRRGHMSEIERAAPPGVIAPELREIVVVVPAHNERERLPGCLANIAAAAEQVSVPVQVVVVLDTCTDGSEYALPASVPAVRVSLKNVGASRAAGFIAAARLRTHGSGWPPRTLIRWCQRPGWSTMCGIIASSCTLLSGRCRWIGGSIRRRPSGDTSVDT